MATTTTTRYGNPYRAANGRFTTAALAAAASRIQRLTELAADDAPEPGALCPYDVDLAALAILHGGIRLYRAVTS
jgi:hypothetical protein